MVQKKGREVSTYPDWTDAELAEMREKLPSRFFTVTESHAADVIRPQEKYQEVQDVPVVTAGGTLKTGSQAVKPKRKRHSTTNVRSRKLAGKPVEPTNGVRKDG